MAVYRAGHCAVATLKKTLLGDAVYQMRASWELNGYLSLDDTAETEIIFDALVDALQTTLSNDPTFGHLASWVPDYEIKVTLQPVMFCGVLCHSATLAFDVVYEETAAIDGVLNDFNTMNTQYDFEPFQLTAEHLKWLREPTPDYSTSKPELNETIIV